MHKRIEQGFTNGFLGVVLLIRANKSFDRGNSLVAQSEIVYHILKLLEHRPAELLAVTELCAEFILEHGNFDRVMHWSESSSAKVGVNIILCNTNARYFSTENSTPYRSNAVSAAWNVKSCSKLRESS